VRDNEKGGGLRRRALQRWVGSSGGGEKKIQEIAKKKCLADDLLTCAKLHMLK
jgi:hypothetical protein